jgi:hypothetical protein
MIKESSVVVSTYLGGADQQEWIWSMWSSQDDVTISAELDPISTVPRPPGWTSAASS